MIWKIPLPKISVYISKTILGSIIENIDADKDMKSHNNDSVLNQTFSHKDGPYEAPGSYW